MALLWENEMAYRENGEIIVQIFYTLVPWCDYEGALEQAVFFRCRLEPIEQEVSGNE